MNHLIKKLLAEHLQENGYSTELSFPFALVNNFAKQFY